VSRKPLLVLAGISLALLVFALCAREDPSPDAFFHLALGRKIVATHAIPHTNEFLAQERGFAFVDHEWLFQVGAWLAYALGGEELAGLARTLVVLGAYFILFQGLKPAGKTSALVALLPAVLVAHSRLYLLRPELISLLGTAATVTLLERERLAPSRKNVILLALVQLVWANCHGFALMGPGITLAYVLAQFGLGVAGPAAARVGLETTGVRPGSFALLLLLQLGVSLVNPFFHEGALYPVLILFRAGHDWQAAGLYLKIVELQSPFSAALSSTLEIVLFKGALLAGLVAFGFSVAEKRARLEHAVAALLLAGAASSYIRNLPFAAIGLSLPIAHGVAALGRRFAEKRAELARNGVLASVAVASIFLARAAFAGELHANAKYVSKAGFRLSDFVRYDDATAFLDSARPTGNLFNTFGAGHYFIFERGDREPLPYICGDTELYPGDFLREYNGIIFGDKPYGPLLARRNVTVALLDHRVEVPHELIAAFYADPEWRLVHVDGQCVIFMKAGPGAPPAVDLGALARGYPFEDTTKDPFCLTRALRWIGFLPRLEPAPIEKLHLARLLETLGRREDALRVARSARDDRPDFVPTYFVLASLEWQADPVQARKDAEFFAAKFPYSAYGPFFAGQASLVLGDTKAAAASFERALEIDPAFAAAQEELLQAYLREKDVVKLRRAVASPLVAADLRAFYTAQADKEDGRLEEAEKRLQEAISIRPGFSQAHWEYARLLFQRNALKEAVAHFEEAARLLPHDPDAWLDLGVARHKAGDRRGGDDACEFASAIDPKDHRGLLEIGYAALDAGDFERADKYAKLAEARRPGCAKKLREEIEKHSRGSR
jgi:tetratricopeptide (TPR) repeat protein